jgi:hypothetical protein
MFRILLFIIGAIILYKLIFNFIIPVYRTSKDIKKRFREMHQQMNDDVNGFNQQGNVGQRQEAPKKPKDKDYIDFEEVK